MRRFFAFCLLFAVAIVFTGESMAAPRVGGDADSHGCRASAGYSWCPRTKQCERPWELARARSFKNSASAFRKFCDVR
ncbi:hypothetical protein QBC99_000096 [Beijerinckia sp. GAS462]|nr:hypothetical protein [Beijerinckia sp. GAS462]SEB51850.1 hypothetical protein SAMN05443249_0299 [Beijerinckia sp. 28-YEA-48]